jgi:DNA sulfur modification protein DndD
MILEKLILENVGVYAGRQEADLSPKPGKPVILFGGLNGGGKTTILECLQLCFYGSKARLSSRGATPYKEYLRETIHRGSDPGEGAAITVRFRRIIESETRFYEVKRSWRVGVKGSEESLQVWCNGEDDTLLTENWTDYIEGYLPCGIAHLFFFDGEQIKELAEGEHAAEILGTAIQTLLGLDIVDRLETDLRVLGRRKRSEMIDDVSAQKLTHLQNELRLAVEEHDNALMEEGHLMNRAALLGKAVSEAEEGFRREGGEVFERRHAIETEQRRLESEHAAASARLRELAAGPAPLLLLNTALADLEKSVRDEAKVKQAGQIVDTLAARDQALLAALNIDELPPGPRRKVADWLEADRRELEEFAKQKPKLNIDPQIAPEIAHLRGKVLPDLRAGIETEVAKLGRLDDALAKVQAQLDQIPAADTVARLQQLLNTVRSAYQAKLAEHAAAGLRVEASKRHKELLERQIEQVGLVNVDERFAHEDRQRILKHSEKVRATLVAFRTAVIRKHATRLEGLIQESLQQLLRKNGLVTAISIDPTSFAVTLTGNDGQVLPFNRLSAGERQLLATSLLWGLARASGRPIPTVIDTPLGRLDSSHRHHLVERYFPVASHQVILLSTDEEIAEEYYDRIKPYLAREFRLVHDDNRSRTSIMPDSYFAAHETTR